MNAKKEREGINDQNIADSFTNNPNYWKCSFCPHFSETKTRVWEVSREKIEFWYNIILLRRNWPQRRHEKTRMEHQSTMRRGTPLKLFTFLLSLISICFCFFLKQDCFTRQRYMNMGWNNLKVVWENSIYFKFLNISYKN